MTSLRTLSLFAVLLAVGCPTPPPSEAELLAPQLGATSGGEVDLLEVRTIRIAWSGAEGASSRITRTEEAASERAATLSALLRAPGSSFGEVGREYGDVPPSIERLSRPEEESALFTAAVALGLGEVSRPIRTAAGYVVLKRRTDPSAGPSTVGARHILIAYAGARRVSDTVTRTREEAATLATSVRERALAGADWAALHQDNTDEPQSPPGGDLGNFGRGQMVPSFERAVFALDVGGTSTVVETPFGFHIIQRTE